MINEHDLIKQITQGKTHLFESLIKQYEQMGFAIAQAIIKNHSQAQEVLQDAFLIAFQKLHTFSFQSKFSTWFYTILVRQAYKHNKKEKKFQYLPIPPAYDALDDSALDALQSLHIQTQKNIIQDVFNLLKPTENLCLKLFYLQEQSLEEIQQITNLSIPNIKVILHRSRDNFKKILNQKYPHIQKLTDL